MAYQNYPNCCSCPAWSCCAQYNTATAYGHQPLATPPTPAPPPYQQEYDKSNPAAKRALAIRWVHRRHKATKSRSSCGLRPEYFGIPYGNNYIPLEPQQRQQSTSPRHPHQNQPQQPHPNQQTQRQSINNNINRAPQQIPRAYYYRCNSPPARAQSPRRGGDVVNRLISIVMHNTKDGHRRTTSPTPVACTRSQSCTNLEMRTNENQEQYNYARWQAQQQQKQQTGYNMIGQHQARAATVPRNWMATEGRYPVEEVYRSAQCEKKAQKSQRNQYLPPNSFTSSQSEGQQYVQPQYACLHCSDAEVQCCFDIASDFCSCSKEFCEFCAKKMVCVCDRIRCCICGKLKSTADQKVHQVTVCRCPKLFHCCSMAASFGRFNSSPTLKTDRSCVNSADPLKVHPSY